MRRETREHCYATFDKTVSFIAILTENCTSEKKLYEFPTLSLTIANRLENFTLKVAIGKRHSRADILYLCVRTECIFLDT